MAGTEAKGKNKKKKGMYWKMRGVHYNFIDIDAPQGQIHALFLQKK